jgi:hypothetical protein
VFDQLAGLRIEHVDSNDPGNPDRVGLAIECGDLRELPDDGGVAVSPDFSNERDGSAATAFGRNRVALDASSTAMSFFFMTPH